MKLQNLFLGIFLLIILSSESLAHPLMGDAYLSNRVTWTKRTAPPARPVAPPPFRNTRPVAPPPSRVIPPVRPDLNRGGNIRQPVRSTPVDPRRIVRQPDIRRNDPLDRDAHQIVRESLAESGDRCENLGRLLVRISNRMIQMSKIVKKYNGVRPQNRIEAISFDIAQRSLSRKEFWERIWDRLADVYRQCDVECFDSGVSIGQISGLGYCSASVGAGGLNGVGYSYTPPLPLCERSVNIACQSGYREAAQSFQGCELYTQSGYSDIFRQYISQDCKIPD